MRKRCLMLFFTAMVVLHSFAPDGSASTGTEPPAAPAASRDRSRKFSIVLAEQMAGELENRDWVVRKKMLLDYQLRANGKNEVLLRESQGNDAETAPADSRLKTALVLHALRRAAGDDVFSRIAGKAGKEDAPGSWDELRFLCEKEARADFAWFFSQWVDRKGLPDLHVENVTVKRSGSAFDVSFDLQQNGEVYTLDIPVSVQFLRGGKKNEQVRIEAATKHVSLLVDDEPSALVIDADYDLPRRLLHDETPPLLAGILLQEKPMLVLPTGNPGIYAGMIEAWKQRGALEKKADEVRDADIISSSFIVLGEDNPVIGRIYGTSGPLDRELSLLARKNPWNPERLVVTIQAKSVLLADSAIGVLTEAGECSSLSIDAQKRRHTGTAEAARGLAVEMRAEPAVVDLAALRTLADVIEGASRKKIVYVGEYHDRYSHHNVQLEVIKGLYKKDPKLAIGMEMFQRPFQKTLDDYTSGIMDEREFIKKSEYFKRWGFDYGLYKPILDFARSVKLPVIALNLSRDISDKVGKGGLDQVTGEDRKEIPEQMDFSDDEYRARLRAVFEQHEAKQGKSFDFFYEAQVLWDEAMSRSIDEFLKKSPGYRMVVIAGGGHISFGSGIPKRTFRRNGFAYTTILSDVEIEKGVADYIVFPQALDGVTAPKLMVILKETSGTVSITGFGKDSVAQKAGMRIGDAIVALDKADVHSIEDIKLALQFKNREEPLRVTVKRKRFLLGDKEMIIEVKL